MHETVNFYREFYYFLVFTHSCAGGSQNLAVHIIRIVALTMGAASYSETFVCLYQTIRCHTYKTDTLTVTAATSSKSPLFISGLCTFRVVEY